MGGSCCQARLPSSTQTPANLNFPPGSILQQLQFSLEIATSQLQEASSQVNLVVKQPNLDASVLIVKLQSSEEAHRSLRTAVTHYEQLSSVLHRKQLCESEDTAKVSLMEKDLLQAEIQVNSHLKRFQTALVEVKILALVLLSGKSEKSINSFSNSAQFRRVLNGKYKKDLRIFWRIWAKRTILQKLDEIDLELNREIAQVQSENIEFLEKNKGIFEANGSLFEENEGGGVEAALEKGMQLVRSSSLRMSSMGMAAQREVEGVWALEVQEALDTAQASEVRARWRRVFQRQTSLDSMQQTTTQLEDRLHRLQRALTLKTGEEQGLQPHKQVKWLLEFLESPANQDISRPMDYLSDYVSENYSSLSVSDYLASLTTTPGAFINMFADLFTENSEESLLVLYCLAKTFSSLHAEAGTAFLETGGRVYLTTAIAVLWEVFSPSKLLFEQLLSAIRPAHITPLDYLIFTINFRLQIRQIDSLTFFKWIDEDDSKSLSVAELAAGLRDRLHLPIAQEDIEGIFQELDQDRNGIISRLEFTRKVNLKDYYLNCEKDEFAITALELADKVRQLLRQHPHKQDFECITNEFKHRQ